MIGPVIIILPEYEGKPLPRIPFGAKIVDAVTREEIDYRDLKISVNKSDIIKAEVGLQVAGFEVAKAVEGEQFLKTASSEKKVLPNGKK